MASSFHRYLFARLSLILTAALLGNRKSHLDYIIDVYIAQFIEVFIGEFLPKNAGVMSLIN